MTQQINKSLARARRGLPWDRVIKSVTEWRAFMAELSALIDELNQVDRERNALIDLVESQRAELDAFKAAGAASMETYNAKET